MEIKPNNIYLGDCLELMQYIPSKSIDMILCDLPYGTTACKWDTIIPFEPLWKQYERVIKDNGAMVLTAAQPFTTKLITSNLKLFRYELIWEKTMPNGFLDARKKPLKSHENIIIFYKKQPTYNPIKTKGIPYKKERKNSLKYEGYHEYLPTDTNNANGERFPKSIIKFSNGNNNHENGKSVHPTQKPVPLFEYLIKTYTNEGETVLDNCMGSGTAAIAAINTNRNYIGFEKDEHYFKIANKRIQEFQVQIKLEL